MYIQEVIIDGFKSYAHRTVVQGFDPHFNAITGLNGSGKSNILDSICFVLGITNLSQVRAGNLSELVYKQGQAGVNKASVTVVFNNSDESSSPVGYEQCPEVTVTRQVLLGGKSKYLINGRNAPAGSVQNLFHSVQLNVNNPHFLIMQGRITKVLNMKPNEILGMVEEAAGTRMYETKRIAAIKTIDKKQAKVDELNSVLSEEITPTLERLRGEKQSYLKWSKNNADIERIERFVVASQFMEAQEALEGNEEGLVDMEEKVKQYDAQAESLQAQIEEKEEEAAGLASKRQGEYKQSQNMLVAEKEKLSKELVKVTSSWTNSKDLVKQSETEVEAARATVVETKAALDAKEKQKEQEIGSIDECINSKIEAEKELARLTSDFQNMQAGLEMSQGEEGMTLPDQIAKAHGDSKVAEAKIKQAKMQIKHLTKELSSVEKQMKKEQKSAQSLNEKRERLTSDVEKYRATLSELSFNEEEFGQLEKQRDDLSASISELGDLVDTLTAQLAGKLRFDYQDPVRGFDRSKVRGLLVNLLSVNRAEHATAMEVIAGGRLYQVVVDEAITSKALIAKGNLRKRATFIPLDKITVGRRVTDPTMERASNIASSNDASAWRALDLIGFEEDVRQAIEYTFASSIVVDGPANVANRICDETKTSTVTLEGDVYSPSGSISGGSKGNLGTTLGDMNKLAHSKGKLSEQKKQLAALDKQINSLRASQEKYENISKLLEIAEAELKSVQKHLSQTSYGVLEEKFGAMSKELEEAQKIEEEMKSVQEEKWTLYNELKEREEELTQQREVRLTQIEDSVQEAKNAAAVKTKLAKEAESRIQTLSLELESLKADVVAAEEALETAKSALKEVNDDASAKQIKVGEVKALFDDALSALQTFEDQLAECDAELSKIKSQKKDLSKEAEASRLESKKLSVQISRIQKERQHAESKVAKLLKEYSWIESEKSAFGVAGGDYDFEAINTTEMSHQLKTLKSEQDSLSKKINKKVMGMIEKAEGEYTELLRKRKVVENDKKKIKSVIEELDVKKKTELERTWKKVNKDFGSIFSTLLAGASAKLEPPEGMQAWQGLEVKVAFGDVWKESLSELSGGQRSLLALSLILSLLLFKPAPMYILDEVDAALDLSHTQNIGNMLKTHFSQSQFIVVSLKEGMFNNANVIFRTKFVDGVSTVARTIGTGASSRARAFAESQQRDVEVENQGQPRKRQARGARQRGKENSAA